MSDSTSRWGRPISDSMYSRGWRLSLRPNVMWQCALLAVARGRGTVCWLLSFIGFWFQYIGLGFFFFWLGFFLSTSISVWLHRPLILVYWVLVFFFFFFFFFRIHGFATICNLLGLLYHLLFRIDVRLFFPSGLALLPFLFLFFSDFS